MHSRPNSLYITIERHQNNQELIKKYKQSKEEEEEGEKKRNKGVFNFSTFFQD